jgi:hypothetical protein
VIQKVSWILLVRVRWRNLLRGRRVGLLPPQRCVCRILITPCEILLIPDRQKGFFWDRRVDTRPPIRLGWCSDRPRKLLMIRSLKDLLRDAELDQVSARGTNQGRLPGCKILLLSCPGVSGNVRTG